MDIYPTPYTYLIGWTMLNKWYYGVRFAKNCHPNELFVSYFTSSKYVKQIIEEHGNPDVVSIRKTFTNTQSARKWETKVLKRMNVVTSPLWINKTDNHSIDPICANLSRIANKGKTYNEIYGIELGSALKAARSLSNIKRGPRTETTKFKISEARKQKAALGTLNVNTTGFINVERSRKQLSELAKIRFICEHCAIQTNKGNYYRWHGEKCRR